MILMNCSQAARKHPLVKTEDTGNENVGSRDYNDEDNEYNEVYNEDNKLVTEAGL